MTEDVAILCWGCKSVLFSRLSCAFCFDHVDVAPEDDGEVVRYNAPIEIRSRDANKKCPCGSGKKLKKCCGI